MQVEATSPAGRRAVRSTYRTLRLGLVVLLLALLLAVVTESALTGCRPGSLSAYYWTGARDVLVGALVAIGALLVVDTGLDDVEDALLDLAGLLAVVVALVPTTSVPPCAAAPDHAAPAATSLVVLLVAAVVTWAVRTAAAARGGLVRTAALVRAAGGVLVVGAALVGLLSPDVLRARAHGVAAVLLLVSLVVVVLVHGFRARAVSTRWAALYSALGAAQLLTLAAVVALHALAPGRVAAVLTVEAALVGLFALYWVLETVERWRTDGPVAAPAGRADAGSP